MKWGHQRLTSNVSPLVRHRRWQGGRGGHHQPHPLAALHLHNSDIRCLRSQTNIKPWRSLGSSCPWRSRRPWPGAAMNKSRSRFPQSWSSSAPWYTSRAQPAELKSLGLVFLNPSQHQEDGTKPEKGGIFHFGWIKRQQLTPLSYVCGVLKVLGRKSDDLRFSSFNPPSSVQKKYWQKLMCAVIYSASESRSSPRSRDCVLKMGLVERQGVRRSEDLDLVRLNSFCMDHCWG